MTGITDPKFKIGMILLILITVIAVFAPLIAPYPADLIETSLRLCPLSSSHLLGCDVNGGDVLTSILYGARISLYIGLATVFLCATIGMTLGLVSGYAGGIIDGIIMRIVDILMAFPGILLAMTLAAVMGPSIHNIIFAISATGWIGSTRLIRGQVLSIKEREFVLANKALGASTFRTVFFHVLPSTLPSMIVHATFSLSGVIIAEAALSFLGLGPQQGTPTWGALLSQGKSVMIEAPILTIAPGLAIMTTVLALNFVGDSLRDYLDPKSRTL